jgi:multiple sugar transport system permease protein
MADNTQNRNGKMITAFIEDHFYFILLIPTIILTLLIVIFPLLYSIWLSFFDATLINFLSGPSFIGLKNYWDTLTDPEFLHSLQVGVSFSLISTGLELILGFTVAYFVYSCMKTKRVILIPCILAPLMLTPVVVALMWRFMLNYEIGIINYFTSLIGIGTYPWLGTKTLAFWSIVMSDVWQQTPFAFLILLAGLESMPIEPFEAAKVDGANRWQILSYIILPFMRGPIFVALIFRTIDSFKIFDKVSILTGGGPGAATETLNIYMYRIGFQCFNFGRAACVAQIIIMIIMALAWLFFKFNRLSESVE